MMYDRLARLAFARHHWTSNEWAKVLWSDESKFNLFSSDGIRYVRRPQRYNPKYQVPTVKHGGRNVMIKKVFTFFFISPYSSLVKRALF